MDDTIEINEIEVWLYNKFTDTSIRSVLNTLNILNNVYDIYNVNKEISDFIDRSDEVESADHKPYVINILKDNIYNVITGLGYSIDKDYMYSLELYLLLDILKTVSNIDKTDLVSTIYISNIINDIDSEYDDIEKLYFILKAVGMVYITIDVFISLVIDIQPKVIKDIKLIINKIIADNNIKGSSDTINRELDIVMGNINNFFFNKGYTNIPVVISDMITDKDMYIGKVNNKASFINSLFVILRQRVDDNDVVALEKELYKVLFILLILNTDNKDFELIDILLPLSELGITLDIKKLSIEVNDFIDDNNIYKYIKDNLC